MESILTKFHLNMFKTFYLRNFIDHRDNGKVYFPEISRISFIFLMHIKLIMKCHLIFPCFYVKNLKKVYLETFISLALHMPTSCT